MKKILLGIVVSSMFCFTSLSVSAQCNTNSANSCVCEQSGQTDCDLLPDMTISWDAAESVQSGPTEYSQSGNGSNNGRLRVSGSTPNIGHGPLNVRGVDQNGYRWFLCGTDTISIYDPSSTQDWNSCPNNESPRQLIFQRIYHKDGNSMEFTERFAGTMTYHPTHGHNHVDDWATFTLRIEDQNEPNPLNWPIVGDGAKIGFCLMDYYPCTSGSAYGHCRTSQEYGGGSVLSSSSQFDNYGLGGGGYNCSQVSQGISVGYTDLYGEWLDGMWVDIPPGTCNGDYWIVLEVDPNDNFIEEDENNNWTAIPFELTEQEPAGGDFANISSNGSTTACEGSVVELTASAGNAYLWSTGETTQTIQASSTDDYSVTVTGQCGTDESDPVSVSIVTVDAPIGTGATLQAPGSATISATGNAVEWYDAENGGNLLASGNDYTTPVLNSTTSYWAEETSGEMPQQTNGGKPNNSGGGAYFDNNQSLIFNAYEQFKLVSVRMYAGSAGTRHILCTTAAGDLIAQDYVQLAAGEQVVPLDFIIPEGDGHQITVWDDDGNTSTYIRDVYRNNANVNYPYALGLLGEIERSTASTNNGLDHYYFFYDWVVESMPLQCESERTEVTVTVSAPVVLSAKAFLEGPFDANGAMFDDLRANALLPLQEPFTDLGFTHVNGGDESTTAPVFATGGPNAIIDWVMVELRDQNNNAVVVDTRSALLQSDGDIVDVDGSSPVSFTVAPGSYHVALRHRNHLGIMTDQPIALSSIASSLDFTNGSINTWGIDAQKDINGYKVLWMGNTTSDYLLKYTGADNDRDPILISIGGSTPTDTNSGYLVEDCNMDGLVKYTGSANDRDPILVNIGGAVPTNTRVEQLP